MSRVYTLVYQAGIANVFAHEDGNPIRIRLAQTDFRTAESFCRGLREAGRVVHVAWCNEAGDIIGREWQTAGFDEAPFSEHFANDFAPTFEPRA